MASEEYEGEFQEDLEDEEEEYVEGEGESGEVDDDLEEGEVHETEAVLLDEAQRQKGLPSNDLTDIHDYLNKMRTMPASDATRQSLKSVRIHRAERRSESSAPKRARQEDE